MQISSTSPVNALISTRSPVTSFTTVEVDGTVDWMIAQSTSLLAWTGYSLRVNPSINQSLSLAYWGNSRVTGRGLMALVGRGQIYSIDLQEGEKYIAHPSNVVAYTISSQLPSPYRFKSTSLNLQIPDIGQSRLLSKFKFIDDISRHELWKKTMTAWHTLKTWMRRTIWGDRLFLQFEGPGRILIQSRGSTISESLTTRQVSEFAHAPPNSSSANIETKPNPESQKIDA
ncbi:hypothetical protein KEM56_007653 [Ascosphaera pollenicola]|nr:hypothetical protein KEM56_007653 [Ascosphaera pollenicola]